MARVEAAEAFEGVSCSTSKDSLQILILYDSSVSLPTHIRICI